MPTDAEHEANFQDNWRLLTANGGLHLTNERWTSVVAFYAALHLVERLAAQLGIHHRRHSGAGSRQTFLAGHLQHRQILADYMALESASEIARYESLGAYQTAFPPGMTQNRLVNGCLQHIRQYVQTVVAPHPASAGPAVAGS